VKGSINTLEESTVVVSKMELYELLRKADTADVDFLREGVRTLAQALMEVEVAAQVGAERGERAPERRIAQRNGYRPREWDTRVGTVELEIPSCAKAASSHRPGATSAG
jgi:putative transposase